MALVLYINTWTATAWLEEHFQHILPCLIVVSEGRCPGDARVPIQPVFQANSEQGIFKCH